MTEPLAPLSHLRRVICNTCGRSNPGHLVFCEECGQRLAPRGAMPAQLAPTSGPRLQAAAGAPPAPLAGMTPAQPSPARMPAAAGTKRPQAPEMSFAARADAGPQSPDTVACPHCGNPMQDGLRFCGECGRPLVDPAMPPVVAIAPLAMVDLGRAPTATQRICARCRGASEQGVLFCRYCGLPFPEPPPAPAPAPVAFTPPPPQATAAPPPLASTASMVFAARARVVLVARDGTEGPSFPLGDVTEIGRSEGQIVMADDRYLSPRHARIAFRGGVFFLSDLGGANGIFFRIPFSLVQPGGSGEERRLPPVDGAKDAQDQQPLEDQDLFLVGQQVLRFEVVKDAEQGFRVAFDNGTLLFGTPAAPRYARLSQRTVEGVVRDVIHLRKAETIIGRESGDIVFTDDPFLSRRHATLRVHGSGADGLGPPRRYTLADLGSSNGTFLQTRGEVCLKPGDQFRVGQQLFRFDLGGSRADA